MLNFNSLHRFFEGKYNLTLEKNNGIVLKYCQVTDKIIYKLQDINTEKRT